MKNYLIVFLLLIVGVISSCSKEEVPVYDSGRYLHYTKTVEDSLFYSFKLNPGLDQDQVAIEINLIGKLLTEDQTIKLVVEEEFSNSSEVLYKLPENPVFHANKGKDTIYIDVYKPTIDTDSTRVFIRLEANENFTPCFEDKQVFKLIVNNKLSKPDWWDGTIVDDFLGDYSDTKYSTFIEVTKVSDLSEKDESEIRALCLKFKYYLQKQLEQGNSILDEDGTQMTVPVVG